MLAVLQAEDEATVRELGDFLLSVVIPQFVQKLRQGRFNPRDGEHLICEMHAHGINVRYLGQLATRIAEEERNSTTAPYILELLELEMVARAVKRIFSVVLSDPLVRAAPAEVIATLLSCILGSPGGQGEPSVHHAKPALNHSHTHDTHCGV